jgi:MFS family permease
MSESTQDNNQVSADISRGPYPLAPGWLVLVTVVAGLPASGPLAGASLYRFGYRKTGWVVGSLTCLLGLLVFLFMILWNTEWYWAAITLTGFHLLSGISLFFALRGPHKIFRNHYPCPVRKRGTYREIIAGIAGGAFISILLGIVFSVFYLIFIDRLLSTFMPVTFEDTFAEFKVFTCVFFFLLSGIIAGGLLGRFKPRISAGQIISYGLALGWAYYSWLMAVECTVAIPGFQAGAATGGGWSALITPYYSGNLLVGIWWSVFLLFFIISPSSIWAKWTRVLQVAGINLAAGITLSITFGYPADMYLSLGRHFERTALTEKALWCYEHGLKKKPQARVASYLQYRVALLNHRLGDREKAKQGFRRVVAKYTANKALVKKANRLLDNLDRSPGRKRVVLDGVETRTGTDHAVLGSGCNRPGDRKANNRTWQWYIYSKPEMVCRTGRLPS